MEQITITRSEFNEKALKALEVEEEDVKSQAKFTILIAGMYVISKLEKSLFEEKSED